MAQGWSARSTGMCQDARREHRRTHGDDSELDKYPKPTSEFAGTMAVMA